jgi:peptidoglycan-N-acetylglucosamine deacetylase
MKKGIVISCILLAVLAALAFASWKIIRSRTFQFFGGIVDSVETDEKVVALTFDDGPSPKTDEILGILSDADVKATFFLVGEAMEEYPQETRRIVEDGHQIANHTYSHRRMIFLPLSTIASEIERTDALIRAAGYEGEIQFRPPHANKLVLLPYYLKQHSRKTLLWTLEPNSYPEVNANSEKITEYVLEHVKPGSIILLHVMYDKKGTSVGAIKGIAEGLKDMGYKFVTVNELLGYSQK